MSLRNHAAFHGRTRGDEASATAIGAQILAGFRARGSAVDGPTADGGRATATVVFDGAPFELSVERLVGDGHHDWLVALVATRGGLLRRSTASPQLKLRSIYQLHEILTEDLGLRPHWFSAAEWRDPHCEVGATIPA